MGARLPRDRRWLGLVGDLLREPAARGSPHEVIGPALVETFSAHGASWNAVDATWTDRVQGIWSVGALPRVPPGGRPADPSWQPLLRWYARTGGTAPQTLDRVPQRVADEPVRAAWRSFAAPLGIEQQIAIPVLATGGCLRAYVVARPGEDFSDDDLELARLLQPLLSVVVRHDDALAAQRGAVRPQPGPGAPSLTRGQHAVLVLLADGCTAGTMGRRLGISPRTAQKHLQNLYTKLGTGDRVSAVLRAQELGLVPSPSARP
jgi:DNA-binding CsgD family transcriptional regulator